MASELLPPWAAEDHRCDDCNLDYSVLSVPAAVAVIAAVPDLARAGVVSTPDLLLRRRPIPDTWSMLEYLCHIRDVYATYTIRLFRTRTENAPAVEPMLNDLRVQRFRYNQLDPAAVLDELTYNIAGYLDEIGRVRDWSRVASRLPAEIRTAKWQVCQAAHEGVHHVRDIERVRVLQER